MKAAQSPATISALVNRPAIGNLPSQKWLNLLRDGLIRAALPGCTQGLQAITKARGTYLIVDDVQTGFGGTGKFWGHENWNLSAHVDIVIFSKKAQTEGCFFSDNSLRPDKAYR